MKKLLMISYPVCSGRGDRCGMAERGGRGLPSYNRTPTSQRFSPLDQSIQRMSVNLSVECVYLTLAALVVSAGIAVDWCVP